MMIVAGRHDETGLVAVFWYTLRHQVLPPADRGNSPIVNQDRGVGCSD
jgi:hypothetical protein